MSFVNPASTRRALLSTAALCAPLARPLAAQQPTTHDHDGPPPAPRLGEISFPTTSTSPAAHAAFVTGVLLMHNFHYPRAADAFRQAQRLDSGDVMAYWGEAMTYTHPVWNQQDVAAARAVLARLGPTREARLARARTPRERAWLDAAETLYGGDAGKAQRDTAYAGAMAKLHAADTAYAGAMAKLHAADTADVEATTFYALALLGLSQGERNEATYAKAYALVRPVFAAHPMHPGAAHYLVHAVDDPQHAKLGLAAARAYSDIAPSAGHALHMTSHIVLALRMWDDVVAANLRAQASSSRGLQGHVVHWLHYALLQQGRYAEADRGLDTTRQAALSATAADWRADAWDAAGLMAAANLADTRRWTGPAGSLRVDSATFGAASPAEMLSDFTAAQFGIALGALHRGERALFDSSLGAMTRRREAVAGDPLLASARGESEVMEKILHGYAFQLDGKPLPAPALFRSAALEEDRLPVFFGPPLVARPPHEAAGALLLELHRPAEARREFAAGLARTPGRPSAPLGLARAERASGRAADAAAHYRMLADVWHLADAGNPDVDEARAGAGKLQRATRAAAR
jgi:hypothetical protein